LIHQRRINPVPRSEERRQCHRLRRACRHCAHIPCDGEPERTATGAAPPVPSLALRLDSPAGPGNQGWVRRNNNSGATGNSVDRLPPTLARVAGGEVAYAASQVLCARADRSCASLASATTRKSCECHGTFVSPSRTDVTPSVRSRRKAVYRAAAPATPAVWPVKARRLGSELPFAAGDDLRAATRCWL
jgi:hypothetical protein